MEYHRISTCIINGNGNNNINSGSQDRSSISNSMEFHRTILLLLQTSSTTTGPRRHLHLSLLTPKQVDGLGSLGLKHNSKQSRLSI
jgi:hypothetical protein